METQFEATTEQTKCQANDSRLHLASGKPEQFSRWFNIGAKPLEPKEERNLFNLPKT